MRITHNQNGSVTLRLSDSDNYECTDDNGCIVHLSTEDVRKIRDHKQTHTTTSKKSKKTPKTKTIYKPAKTGFNVDIPTFDIPSTPKIRLPKIAMPAKWMR